RLFKDSVYGVVCSENNIGGYNLLLDIYLEKPKQDVRCNNSNLDYLVGVEVLSTGMAKKETIDSIIAKNSIILIGPMKHNNHMMAVVEENKEIDYVVEAQLISPVYEAEKEDLEVVVESARLMDYQ
ncbi:MAG: hypothetical protein Q8Q35_01550, partial [Nanoarchaeota archaeon]|nr:hypothetical protein [Nanoarchaeota archaeon]